MSRMGYNPVAQAVHVIRNNQDLKLPNEVASAIGKLERLEALAAETQRAGALSGAIVESIVEREAIDMAAVAALALQPVVENHLEEAVDQMVTRVFGLLRQHRNAILDTVRKEFFDPALEQLTELANNTEADTTVDKLVGQGRLDVAESFAEGETALGRLRRARGLIPAIIMDLPRGGARDIAMLNMYRCPDIALEVLDDPFFTTELAQTLEIIRRGGGPWIPAADEIRAHRPVYEQESLQRYVDADGKLASSGESL